MDYMSNDASNIVWVSSPLREQRILPVVPNTALEMSSMANFESSRESVDRIRILNAVNTKEDALKPNAKVPPNDRFNVVLLAMFFFGIASASPWNFFITANDYWMYKFRNTSAPAENFREEKTELQITFTSFLAIASTAPMVLAHAFNTFTSHRISPNIRMGIALLFSLLMTILTAAMTQINTDSHQMAFLIGTIFITIIINAMGALLQGAAIGIAGCLPNRYMKAAVVGMAAGGIFAAIAQIATLMTDPHPTESGLAYFLCGAATLALTLAAFAFTRKAEFYRYYMSTQAVGKNSENSSDVSIAFIFRKIWPYAICLFFTFTVTLSVFPGVVVNVVSMNPHLSIWTDRLFLPVCCFLLFNLGDLSGRLVGGWLSLPPKNILLIFSMVAFHALHIPLLMLCNSPYRNHLPVVFHSDVFFITFMTTLGLFNGYLVTVFLIRGPKCVAEEIQQTAGTVMAAFQGVGLMTGSILSYGFTLALKY